MRTKVNNDFVKRALGMADSPGLPGHHEVQGHRVPCPKCVVGGAVFVLKVYKSALVGEFDDPKRCEACGAWIRCKPKVSLEGVLADG